VESELFALTLLRAGAAACVGIVLVLILRAPVRRLFGPEVAYRLWLIAPLSVAVSFFPSFAAFKIAWTPELAKTTRAALPLLQASNGLARLSPILMAVWVSGASLLTGVMLAAELSFRRRARLNLVGPAVVGIAAPRLVVPRDFETRFDAAERDLIRRHERAHIQSGHPTANAVGAALQVIFWFNPLVHLGAALARVDQELACDAAVLEFRPFERRAYAEVLLKAASRAGCGPLACALASKDGRALERRIRWLMRREAGVGRHLIGVVAVSGAATALAVALWAGAPDEGLLSPHWEMAAGAAQPVQISVVGRRPGPNQGT
jgi:beta-lactamase regulating signal transducer with metallopeptidase domain